MASDSAADAPDPDDPSQAGDPTLSPATRRRLQSLFQHGKQQSKQKNYDYAHDMFSGCVKQDPSNLVYVETMFDNLQRKFDNNKKGGRARGNRNALKKSTLAEDWPAIIENGLELLVFNPWDVATLRAMATACAHQHHNEVELRYLKNALDAKPKDVDINLHCAESLARMGQFDQAIACLVRIRDIAPDKQAIKKRMTELTMAKTMPADVDDADEKPKNRVKQKSAEPPSAAVPPPSESPGPTAQTREAFEAAIVEDPAEPDNYLRLAKILQTEGELREAEEVLKRALAVSGNSPKVQEKLESVQLLNARRQLAIAEKQAQTKGTEAATNFVTQLKDGVNRLELEIYNRRVMRHPDDLSLKYELASRLKKARNYAEAAKYFQEATVDEKYLSAAQINRGECLQYTHQYEKALACYVAASESAPNSDVRKVAFYRAGVLAGGLKQWENAIKYLSSVLELDANYQDAAQRLDKLKKKSED